MDIVIYYNPECGTSRNVLAIIKAAGYTPTVIEYLTLARGFTTTFAGIAINDVPGFIVAQLVGAAIGALTSVVLFPAPHRSSVGVMAPGE